jgi:hypothetical protein
LDEFIVELSRLDDDFSHWETIQSQIGARLVAARTAKRLWVKKELKS